MALPDSLNDLELLVRSRHGLIAIDSPDEQRIETLLRHLSDRLTIAYFIWTPTKGLRKDGMPDSIYNTGPVDKALQHIEASQYPAIYHFQGADGILEDKIVIQRLKDTAETLSQGKGAVILTASEIELPPSISPYCALFHLPSPSIDEYKQLILHLVRDLQERVKLSVKMTVEEGHQLINNLKGLTLMEAEKILTKIMIEDGTLTVQGIRKVIEAKKDIVEKEGLLEYYPAEESLAQIADLAGLKGWLSKRREIIVNPEKAKSFGLTFPKGVLLLGVQGCGKSLCAKAVSMEWSLPLLKLDPSNLYNKYIGESEKNFKRAMQAAEKMSPVILWIDEIEKAFATSGGEEDGGVSTRILGTFLNWMQERKGDVFIIATANAIEKLPPEFLRKGRFDEIFFVDLPIPEARRAVFEIHLKKRKRDPAKFNLPALVQASDGYTGAEIEQAIVSALYSAFSNDAELTNELLLKELQMTHPLSQTMKEKVDALREWARERTVSAQ